MRILQLLKLQMCFLVLITMFTWANSIGFCSNNPPADGDTIAEGVIEEPEPIPDGEDFCSSDDPTSIPDSLNPIQLEIQ